MTAPVSDLDVASFRRNRRRLFGIAYRVVGSATEADDVVQDAWLRWQRTDRSEIRDSGAFLATTTTRLAINVTQSAHARRETPVIAYQPESADPRADPSLDLERGEALELALRMLLAKLSPTERAAYVLREAFDYPYREIARVLALNEANARQLVVRARRRLMGGNGRAVEAAEHQRFGEAFAEAAQFGALAPFERLLAADCERVAPQRRAAMTVQPQVCRAA